MKSERVRTRRTLDSSDSSVDMETGRGRQADSFENGPERRRTIWDGTPEGATVAAAAAAAAADVADAAA